MPRFIVALFAAFILALSGQSVPAQDAIEINRIIRGLAPIAGQTIAGGGSNLLAAPAPGLGAPPVQSSMLVEVVLQDRIIFVDTTYAMDFEVYFPFDSAVLTPRARQELLALGQALASAELRPYRYLIAGHTDAVGQAAYNQTLSERRAAAVVQFLMEAFPIAPDRLVSVGFGQQRLKLPDQPRAAVNRRVEVMLIAGQ